METGDVWTPERLAHVDRFWDIQEKIHRSVWGIAPPRHVLARFATPTPWHQSWATFQQQQYTEFQEQQ
ncbi:MAG: hypothetical protein FWH27_01690 [Planctomycetaceae bacterium]|nr:hypothetical protein [Planctomycetaceae bacterium]